MKKLIPLEISHENGVLEEELKKLFSWLFQAHLAERANDVNVYGAPFLGSEQLVRRYLAVNRINAVVSEEAAAKNIDNLRYLLMAVISQNPKRGLHFLKLFIKCLWGNEFEIIQLYQHKKMAYPDGLYEPSQIRKYGFRESEMFLTSRLRIKLSGMGSDFPDTIPKLLEGILPARLLINDVLRQFEISAQAVMFASSAVVSMNDFANVIEYVKVEPTLLRGSRAAFFGNVMVCSIVGNPNEVLEATGRG